MMRRESDRIVIDLSSDQFDSLLLQLGYGVGAALGRNDRNMANAGLRVVNVLNEGNPDYRPYEGAEEVAQ